ncbi:hypothetical protein BT96DRAFT_996541 [Gymnopus androsaceus JB14]|uniref:DUF6534 domain-containing protein n=1 Tax=Gymnopus androsaceus JB14 TaxID=1447944 RepID=A0A6A4HE46_9AGAR|nr:hypothetical protein BT96DRAFT_996541 [Gymnopus androsaceus JB14]
MDSLNLTLGPLLVGWAIGAFFQGVLTLQVYNYFENFPEDSKIIKCLVATTWVIDLVDLALVGSLVYKYLITDWGNLPALAFTTKETDLHITFDGLSSFLCQMFFIRRIWVLSKRNRALTGFLAVGSLAALAIGIAFTVKLFGSPFLAENHTPSAAAEFIAILSLDVGVDVIIGVLICYYLYSGSTGFKQTKSLISRIVQYTYLLMPSSNVFAAFHLNLGRMYTNALLASLNARTKLRSFNDDSDFFEAHVRNTDFPMPGIGSKLIGRISTTGGKRTLETDSFQLSKLQTTDIRDLDELHPPEV